jgi:acyl-CoA synthetase (AMP-forming)/AMP-acid ligase II
MVDGSNLPESEVLPLYPRTWAIEYPDHPAQIVATSGEVLTYRELDRRSNQIARVFREAGLSRGDHVALLMENHPQYLTVVWAALRSGLYYTPINRLLTTSEVAHVVADSDAKVVVASTAAASVAAELSSKISSGTSCFMLQSGNPDAGLPAGWAPLGEAAAAQSVEPLADESEGTSLWYSSGTTGLPKGVLRPLPEGVMGRGDSVAMAFSRHWGFDRDTVHLALGPLYHAAPVGYAINVQRFGGTVVLTEHFDPEETLRAIERYHVNFAHFVPTMFVRLLKLPEETRRRYDLSSLKTCVHGAAPCSVEVKRRMIEWLGPIIHEYYAGTEGAGMTTITPQEWLERPGSVGRSNRGIIHIVGDDGEEVPAGQDGTVYFEDPTVRNVYYKDPAQTAALQESHGWRTLGDVGHVDEDGYLYLTDRWTFKIVSGGVNIFPREAEDVLLLHPAVLDVAVIGVPHAEMGEEVKAVVELVEGQEESSELALELIDWCRERIAHYKCPRSVDFTKELPRQENGKLYKRVLRDRYWQQTGRDRGRKI